MMVSIIIFYEMKERTAVFFKKIFMFYLKIY